MNCRPLSDMIVWGFLHIFGGDWCKRLDLDPCCEVADSHQQKLGLPLAWAEWTNYEHSSYDEWPWGHYVCSVPSLRSDSVSCSWDLRHFWHNRQVTLYGWPIVSGSKDLCWHRSGFWMVLAYAFMISFSEKLLGDQRVSCTTLFDLASQLET